MRVDGARRTVERVVATGRVLQQPVRRLSRAALGNAHRAMADVREARHERLALQDEGASLVPLTPEEIDALLTRQQVGRFVFVARAGQPDVVPVNYAYADGCVLIRSGPGPKLQAAERGELVAFEVDDIDPATRSGCSVVLTGRSEVLAAWEPTPHLDVWAGEPRRHVIRIVPSRMDGRRLQQPSDPREASSW
jgi:hypothetical protein